MRKVLIDTNLLVLLIAGSVDRALIGRHRRLRSFSDMDFQNLSRLANAYPAHVSIPNVLTEASNLLGAEDQEIAPGAALALRRYADRLDEVYQPSREVMQDAVYGKLGLADAAILRTALTHGVEVLTVEYALHGSLMQLGGKSINLRHYG